MTPVHLKWLLAMPAVGLMVGVYTVVDFIGGVSLPVAPENSVGMALQPAPIAPTPIPVPISSVTQSNFSVPSPASRDASSPSAVRTHAHAAAGDREPMPGRDTAPLDRGVARQAAYDPDPNSRAQAIQQLATARGADAVYALGETLRDDLSSNRFLGIESLRLMAWNTGDPDGSIRMLLRSAAQDPDANVAQHARGALDELMHGLP